MPKKYMKKRAPKRRRLGVGAALAATPAAIQYARKGVAYARQGLQVYKDAKGLYDSMKPKRSFKPKYVKGNAIANILGDNITTIKSTVIGKRKPLTFDEKVSRVERPPILFKRNYEFNAEGISGRKTWFSFEFNIMNSLDLLSDLTTYKAQQFTDTATADSTAPLNTVYDGAKFYVDYLSERLQFVNSSTNSMIGKIHLFAHRRDNDNIYASTVPITPINLMMYYSTNRLPQLSSLFENTVGNGWKFDTVTSGSNYNSIYNMPGANIPGAAVTAQTDFELSPSSPHIADSMNFWFRKVETIDFNLKPGQQMNKTYIFNDLKDIMREEQASFVHLANVSYSCVVEFRGGIVGDIATDSQTVSTGISQMSVMRESKRVIGIKNKLKSKVYLVTAAPTIITQANQQIINPDSGTQRNAAQTD